MTMRSLGMTFLLVLLLPLFAAAQQKEKGSIELRSLSEVEVATMSAGGAKEIKRVDTSKAKVVPGDTVVFTTTYRNIGAKPAEKVMITNPVPEHTSYVAGSAEGRGMNIGFSADNGASYAPADKLTLKDAKGAVRKAEPADYTHIRWTMPKPLPSGGKGSVSFKAKIK